MTNDNQQVPPPVQMFQILLGMWGAQIAGACAKFGVADAIADGVTSSAAIAQRCGADASAMYRLLRGAATVGLITEAQPDHFGLTPVGECLRTNVAGSLRD